MAIILSGCRANAEKPEYTLEMIEPTIGIGLLKVSQNRDVPLYADMEAKAAFDTIRFSVVPDGEDKGKFLMETTDSLYLRPFTYYPGDSEKEANMHIGHGLTYFAPDLAFKVVEIRDGMYRVVLNEETFETAVIKNDPGRELYLQGFPYWRMDHNSGPDDEPWYLYETWEVYLKRMRLASVDHNEIYDSPEGLLITGDPVKGGVIGAVDGRWARLEQRDRRDEQTILNQGWVEWTDGVNLKMRLVPEFYF